MAHTNEVQLVPNAGWDQRIAVCRNPDLVDTFIITTRRYVVIVDTMINEVTGRKLLELALGSLGKERQLLVVNTHADYDHCWGNMVFGGKQAVQRVPIIGSSISASLLRDSAADEKLAQMRQREPEIFNDVLLVPPTIQIEGQVTIDGGDLSLVLMPAPGHTADHYALFIPEINTLLAADAAELPYPMARTVDGLPAMRQSLAALEAMKAETVLYCHAAVTSGPQLLSDNRAYFDMLEEKCQAALDRGVPAKPPESADVAALVGCTYADATPSSAQWQGVHTYYQTDGHAWQIRMMLESLASS